MPDDATRWQQRYERERTARFEAERIAESAIADLYAANRDLDRRVAERTTELEKALREVEAARRAESTFLHGLAHELSTPLHAIIGLCELVRERSDDAQITAGAHEIEQSADRLHQALRTLVEFAAVSGTAAKITPTEVRLGDLADGVNQRWQRRLAQTGMLLVVDIDPDAASTVVVDPARVAQIVDPLIDNAARFGAGRVHVECAVEQADDQRWLRIRVGDEGPGIPAELLPQVFDPFVRGSQSTTGFGMGLALARTVARSLDGRLELVPSDAGAVLEARVPTSPA